MVSVGNVSWTLWKSFVEKNGEILVVAQEWSLERVNHPTMLMVIVTAIVLKTAEGMWMLPIYVTFVDERLWRVKKFPTDRNLQRS